MDGLASAVVTLVKIVDIIGSWSSAGSGGIAGKGGKIKISKNAKILAYNGDRITNNDYTATYYEYDKDGNKTSQALEVMKKQNGSNFIPTNIFIQSGIKRAVYAFSTYDSDKLLNELNLPRDTSKGRICLLQEEHVESFGQGIGSGAGYVELSNGTYKVDKSLN